MNQNRKLRETKCLLCGYKTHAGSMRWGACNSCLEQAGLELAHAADRGKVDIQSYIESKILAKKIEGEK